MKKCKSIVLITALILSLVAAACGRPAQKAPSETLHEAAENADNSSDSVSTGKIKSLKDLPAPHDIKKMLDLDIHASDIYNLIRGNLLDASCDQIHKPVISFL